ncbi:hypothetical protein [Candidatus Odyssella thessalonicensis]|uniref:hypothetical protein n=1 Tax=Candidatus Odyssella thessalonicensis TaxID=84647 RepID=UPI000225B6F5|nr:hypothetical protein [Candidatus Odyssella thessalonicensis]
MNTQFQSILIVGSIFLQLGYAMESAEEGRKRPLFNSPSYPCKIVKIADERPIEIGQELTACLRTLSYSIHQAHQEADAATIERAYADFLKLSKVYKSEDW